MRKGFTLIELLAVIVILAIIALIATPIVLNIIEDAKRSANERSIDNYARALENEIARSEMNNSFTILDDVIENMEYDGSKVNCDISKLKSDGQLYLSECSVNGSLVEGYSYGTTTHETSPVLEVHTGTNKITGYSLNKNGNYGLTVYSNASLDSYITLTVNGTDYKINAVMGEDGHASYQIDLAPKYVSDNLNITLYVDDNAVDNDTTSIKDYCASILADSNYSDSWDFINAVILYGSKTQQIFNYNTANLAENILSNPIDLSSINIPNDVIIQLENSMGIIISGTSVVHNARVGHNIYFELLAGENIDDFTFLVNGVKYKPEYSSGSYKMSIPINNFSVLNMYTLSIQHDGATYETSIPLYYTMALYVEYGPAYSDLEKSLMYYCQEGNKYYY